MKRPGRGQWMIFGLAATLVLVAAGENVLGTADSSKTAVAPPRAAAKKPPRTPVPLADPLKMAEAQLNKLGTRPPGEEAPVDLFKGKTWYVPPPPPPPPKPVPPPKPTAPPIPYAFLGSYQEPNGRLILFLSRGDRVFSVSPGEVLEGSYRIDAVTGGQLGLTYLPLNIQQFMNIGELS